MTWRLSLWLVTVIDHRVRTPVLSAFSIPCDCAATAIAWRKGKRRAFFARCINRDAGGELIRRDRGCLAFNDMAFISRQLILDRRRGCRGERGRTAVSSSSKARHDRPRGIPIRVGTPRSKSHEFSLHIRFTSYRDRIRRAQKCADQFACVFAYYVHGETSPDIVT